MFVEINEVGRYCTNKKDIKGKDIYDTVIQGKVLINVDHIRAVSICGFEWKDIDNHIIDYNTIRYCVYFDKDRYIYTDIESYNKIKNIVLETTKKQEGI